MDVVVWLRGLGLGRYEVAFREDEIDETVLRGLTAPLLLERDPTISKSILNFCLLTGRNSQLRIGINDLPSKALGALRAGLT
jgi:hypothetical protein